MGIALKDLPIDVQRRVLGHIERQSEAVRAIAFDVPVRTVTEGNAKEHWRVRHGRAKAQRRAVANAMAGRTLPALPVVVTITRLSAATMDSDNLPGSQKHVRDEIAAQYGVGDSPTDPIEWHVAQEKCKRGTYGVRVAIARSA